MGRVRIGGVEDLYVGRSLTIPRAELSWRFSRSGGPGGQGVNTADSRVELSWDVERSEALPPALRERALARLSGRLVDGVLTVTASEHRAQLQNRKAAAARLVAIAAAAIAPPGRKRLATKPTAGSVQRRLDSKRRHSDLKNQRRSVDD
jgi:ribosome-associated protein